MITKNLTETVIEIILKTDTEMIWLPLPEIFSSVLHLFTYLLAPVAVSSFCHFQSSSSTMVSKLRDHRVNACFHFLLWADSELQTQLSYIDGIGH